MKILTVRRAKIFLIFWIGVIIIGGVVGYVISDKGYNNNNNYENPKYFHVGPRDDLVVIGIVVSNIYIYSFVIGYCFCNTTVRVVNQNVLYPWLLHQVQHKKSEKKINSFKKSFKKKFIWDVVFTTIIHSGYYWIDWIIYLNLLLAQIDFFLVEVITDIIVNVCINLWYIHSQKSNAQNNKNINNIGVEYEHVE